MRAVLFQLRRLHAGPRHLRGIPGHRHVGRQHGQQEGVPVPVAGGAVPPGPGENAGDRRLPAPGLPYHHSRQAQAGPCQRSLRLRLGPPGRVVEPPEGKESQSKGRAEKEESEEEEAQEIRARGSRIQREVRVKVHPRRTGGRLARAVSPWMVSACAAGAAPAGAGDAASPPCGTTSGVPVSGSGKTEHRMPKTSRTISSVITLPGGPSATPRPSFITTRWSA